MATSQDAALPSGIQKPLRECLPMMIVHPHQGNTIFLDEQGSLGYRLPASSWPVWCTDGFPRETIVFSEDVCMCVCVCVSGVFLAAALYTQAPLQL
eukprot:4792572-Amphidinium_carterae.2